MVNIEILDNYIKDSIGKNLEIIINENQTINGKVENTFSNINLQKGKFIVIDMILKKEEENTGAGCSSGCGSDCNSGGCDSSEENNDGDVFGIYEHEQQPQKKKCCDKKLNIELEELELIEEINQIEEGLVFVCGVNRFSIKRVEE